MKPTPFDTDLDTLNLTYAQKQLIKQFVSEHIIGEYIVAAHEHFKLGYNRAKEEQRLALYGIKEQDNADI